MNILSCNIMPFVDAAKISEVPQDSMKYVEVQGY